jgi:hypothetical protein
MNLDFVKFHVDRSLPANVSVFLTVSFLTVRRPYSRTTNHSEKLARVWILERQPRGRIEPESEEAYRSTTSEDSKISICLVVP